MSSSRPKDPNFDPGKIRIARDDEGIYIQNDGVGLRVARVARVFPRSKPNHFVSFLDEMGHEMGVVEDPGKLDTNSRTLLEAELKTMYFIPEILEVRSVTTQGISHHLEVLTDDGEDNFTVENLDALDGTHPPGILIRSGSGKRYSIEDYWELSGDSRKLMAHMVPRRVLQFRKVAKGFRTGR